MYIDNTFYYTVSSIPQILAAVTAVIGAFVFFRLDRIRNLMIGDGKAIISRKESYTPPIPNLYLNRLIDAVHRRNPEEIKEVLEYLSNREKKEFEKSQKPTGFQYIFENRFCAAAKAYNVIKYLGFTVLSINVLTIIFSILCLRYTDSIISSHCSNVIFNSIIFSFLLSIISALGFVIYSICQKTIYEDRNLRDEIIRRIKEGE